MLGSRFSLPPELRLTAPIYNSPFGGRRLAGSQLWKNSPPATAWGVGGDAAPLPFFTHSQLCLGPARSCSILLKVTRVGRSLYFYLFPGLWLRRPVATLPREQHAGWTGCCAGLPAQGFPRCCPVPRAELCCFQLCRCSPTSDRRSSLETASGSY